MSGENCFNILKKIFVPKKQDSIKGYNIKYGHIINTENKEIIDEVLVSYFVKPKSYTTENMCEINSHGGYQVEKDILMECIENGARLSGTGRIHKKSVL
jgi:tRNA modification GTPase